jgi:hypothetical protein
LNWETVKHRKYMRRRRQGTQPGSRILPLAFSNNAAQAETGSGTDHGESRARRDRAEVSIAQHTDVFLANDRRHNVTDDVHCVLHCVLHGADPAFYPTSGDGVSVPVCRQVASFVKDSRSLPCGRATYQSRSCTHRGHCPSAKGEPHDARYSRLHCGCLQPLTLERAGVEP